MTQNEGQNFGSSSRALGAFDQRGPYGILIHLGVDFVKMNESQFRAENPAAKYPLPYRQKLLITMCTIGSKFVIVLYTVRIVGRANK